MPEHDELLLIAAREPVAGETKTRLGATIGMDRAAMLYRAPLPSKWRLHPGVSIRLGVHARLRALPHGDCQSQSQSGVARAAVRAAGW